MEEKLSLLKEEVEKEMKNVQTTADVENIRVEYLGKKGKVVEILKKLKTLQISKINTYRVLTKYGRRNLSKWYTTQTRKNEQQKTIEKYQYM